jgi:hypothetical protein
MIGCELSAELSVNKSELNRFCYALVIFRGASVATTSEIGIKAMLES